MSKCYQNKSVEPDELLKQLQRIVKEHDNSRNMADALTIALVAYHGYATGEITEEAAQMRLNYANDFYGKYVNGERDNDGKETCDTGQVAGS